ncbi:hypothetical protein HN51_017121 [Arachis hypogaea]|uniref:Protein ECERIFERUM n=2 Tax=Arachis hypogaea TaxID=3818 RepID=A0A445CW50_ARAHY|nr:hypothetical protein Ahy_A06g030359 [Arachis hypogaea]
MATNNDNNNIVSYICKRTVVSTKPIEPGKYMTFSVLDRCMEKNHIRMVYYYQSSSTSLGEGEFGKMTKNLKETLSEMLNYYPMVTGRLVRDSEEKWKVKCNDAGVRVVEAKAKGSVEEWLKNVDSEKEHMLVYWEDMYHKPYYWSTFYVQITEFEEGGLAIGLSCFHLLADYTSATNFLKAWSDISLGNKITVLPLFHPLPSTRKRISNHHPYFELINHYKSSIERPIPIKEEKYTIISLGFSHQMVNACISKAQFNGPSGPITMTPFEALAGLFWASISNIKGLQNGLIDMSICLDARKVLGLDYGFFGNTMIYNKVHSNGNLEGNIFVQATRYIGEVVAKMDNEGIMDLIEWLEKNEMNSPKMINGPDLICVSLENVDPYLSVFQDWLKPLRVSCYIEPVLGEGQVLILPGTPEEGPLSRVVMVTLKEDEAIKLFEDDLISQFSPTIFMKC